MNTTCTKCGATASEDQAFCAKCGAVIGVKGAAAPKRPTPPANLGRTMVAGKDFQMPAFHKKPATPPAPKDAGPQAGAAQAPGRAQASPPPPPQNRPTPAPEKPRGNSALLVIAGFVAVLLVGGLLLLLLYFFLRG